jgi:RNA polymerase sigma factor (sigma-70 family)
MRDRKIGPSDSGDFVEIRYCLRVEFEQLVRAATAGDQRAWTRLSVSLWPRLRAWFTVQFRGCDSEALAQDTLIVIWKKLPDFQIRSEAAFMRWIYKVSRFVALAALRQLEREIKLTEALGQVIRIPSPRLSSRLAQAERIELVLREIEKMPESERQAIENLLDGGDARDLAERAGIEWSSARALQSRARKRLRKQLRPSTPTPIP